MSKRNVAVLSLTVTSTVFFMACAASQKADSGPSPVVELAPAPARTEAAPNPEVDSYLFGLKYDPRSILAERVDERVIPAESLPDETKDDGTAIVICKKVKHNLSGNIDDMLILNPTHGVIWPGALVAVDQDMLRGTPAPVSLRRAPAWLSVDLPGIGGRGVFQVDNPSLGTVQAGIDGALDYWNNHQYREGYVSQSRSKFNSTVAYSEEQLAVSLGMSYGAYKTSCSMHFHLDTSHQSKVGVALFKQVFYTVSYDPPSHPGAVFDPGVTLDEVRNRISSEAPVGYVSSVDYGRILMLKIETSADTLQTDIEGAIKYAAFKMKASADYKKLLANSKITLLTIGGNAEVNARAVDATSVEDLSEIIQGKNALYSKSNPGQPIAYTIRFLKDGRLAKMGFSTDYTEITYERYSHGWVGFRGNGNNVSFSANWKEGNEAKSWSSGPAEPNRVYKVELKGNAKEINIKGEALKEWDSGAFNQNHHKRQVIVFNVVLNGPPNKYYVIRGTSWDAVQETEDGKIEQKPHKSRGSS